MPRPGKSTADGQHWVYRLEGRRKCWFQAAEGTATVKKLVRHRAAKHPVATAEENETAARKRKMAVDARAELLRAVAADASRPGPSAPVQVADAGPPLAAANIVSLSPVLNRTNDRLTPDRIAPREVDVEALLAAAPAASDVVAASVPSATPLAFSIAETSDDGEVWRWLGVLLMALGLASVLASSRAIRWALLLHQESGSGEGTA
ncbi:hypothetical protein QA641_12950 [Bradyrhizobium sp. CB1650]|uniref:hypothetical protein n=1 Tax=Bradyrhizobium sp. CB1650 TaxID=3039153 RepID=UPI0024359033|nr:hypothetical protein [Bradyrhizobium sp. CB1650]WGD54732.1 hypothetical protein QA641_12950 [Bradyrhizobium sp. CB1650]